MGDQAVRGRSRWRKVSLEVKVKVEVSQPKEAQRLPLKVALQVSIKVKVQVPRSFQVKVSIKVCSQGQVLQQIVMSSRREDKIDHEIVKIRDYEMLKKRKTKTNYDKLITERCTFDSVLRKRNKIFISIPYYQTH